MTMIKYSFLKFKESRIFWPKNALSRFWNFIIIVLLLLLLY